MSYDGRWETVRVEPRDGIACWEGAEVTCTRSSQSHFRDPERGREKGLEQFVDKKSFRPRLESYSR
jgi:hypothetical protein